MNVRLVTDSTRQAETDSAGFSRLDDRSGDVRLLERTKPDTSVRPLALSGPSRTARRTPGRCHLALPSRLVRSLRSRTRPSHESLTRFARSFPRANRPTHCSQSMDGGARPARPPGRAAVGVPRCHRCFHSRRSGSGGVCLAHNILRNCPSGGNVSASAFDPSHTIGRSTSTSETSGDWKSRARIPLTTTPDATRENAGSIRKSAPR